MKAIGILALFLCCVFYAEANHDYCLKACAPNSARYYRGGWKRTLSEKQPHPQCCKDSLMKFLDAVNIESRGTLDEIPLGNLTGVFVLVKSNNSKEVVELTTDDNLLTGFLNMTDVKVSCNKEFYILIATFPKLVINGLYIDIEQPVRLELIAENPKIIAKFVLQTQPEIKTIQLSSVDIKLVIGEIKVSNLYDDDLVVTPGDKQKVRDQIESKLSDFLYKVFNYTLKLFNCEKVK